MRLLRIFWFVHDVYVGNFVLPFKKKKGKACVLVLEGRERGMAFWRSSVHLLLPAPSFLSLFPTLLLSYRTHPNRLAFFFCYLISCLLSRSRNSVLLSCANLERFLLPKKKTCFLRVSFVISSSSWWLFPALFYEFGHFSCGPKLWGKKVLFLFVIDFFLSFLLRVGWGFSPFFLIFWFWGGGVPKKFILLEKKKILGIS